MQPRPKLDAAASQEEDFIGYTMPPTPAMMDEARDKGESVYMQFVFSPNTIAHSDSVLIDEATRIPEQMQNKYLPLLDYRVVEGYELPTKFIWAAANPLEYSATEPMDEALADRWWMVIPTPSYSTLSEADRRRVAGAQINDLTTTPPEEGAAVAFVDLVAKAKREYDIVRASMGEDIIAYVDAMVITINEGLDSQGKFTLTPPIDGCRVGFIVKNIACLHAVARAKGRKHGLKDDAVLAFKSSVVHELAGQEPIANYAIMSAHDQRQSVHNGADANRRRGGEGRES